MLPKSQRLHTAAQFAKIRRKGQVWRSNSFIAQITAGNQSKSRLGIIVTTKTGKAVIRKRASRILRHGFTQSTFKQPVDIVLIARPHVKDKTSIQIANELRRMVDHLRL